jgi:uncharacterized protein
MAFLRSIAAAALLALALVPAQAQQAGLTPEQEQRINLAADLIEMLTLQPMKSQLVSGTSSTLAKAYEQQAGKITDEQKKAIEETVHVNMAKKLGDLIPLLAPLTADAFTTQELQALVDFYQTPVGQGILDKMLSFQVRSARLAQDWMKQNMGGIEKQILSELEGKGIKIAKPQPAAAQ